MPTKTAAALAFLIATHAFAQSQPAFDAASMKPQDPSVPRTGPKWSGGPGTGDPGRITYNHVDMRDLLAQAYGVGWDQIEGPKWVIDPPSDYSNSFAITATMPKDTTAEQFQLMLQNLCWPIGFISRCIMSRKAFRDMNSPSRAETLN